MVVEDKMRAVLAIAQDKGARKVVLGAWGCGAYGNPVRDIAEAWKGVLDGTSLSSSSKLGKGRLRESIESWDAIEEVVFAISNRGMANRFAEVFAGVEVERSPNGRSGEDENDDEEEDGEDGGDEELRRKIVEMEGQVDKVWNPSLKARMNTILEGLRSQLRDRGDGDEDVDEVESGGEGDRSMSGEDDGEEESEDESESR